MNYIQFSGGILLLTSILELVNAQTPSLCGDSVLLDLDRYKSIFESPYTLYSIAKDAGKTVYGYDEYSDRYKDTAHFNSNPVVCYNELYTLQTESTNSTLTVKDACFVCPDGDDPTQTQCCGDKTEQRCCAYYDDGARKTGVIVGAVFGGLIGLIGLLVLGVKCLSYLRKECE